MLPWAVMSDQHVSRVTLLEASFRNGSTMTKSQLMPLSGILVAIDVAKARNDVLIEVLGHSCRRRLSVFNTVKSTIG